VLSHQLQDQLQTQHSEDTGNYIMGKQKIKEKLVWRKQHLNKESKQTNENEEW
jgi:hypothetical protein